MFDQVKIQDKIHELIGISTEVFVEHLPEHVYIRVRPTDFERNHGIQIHTSLKWRTLKSEIYFESYAAELLSFINDDITRKKVFIDSCNSFKEYNPKSVFTFKINGSLDVTIEEHWKNIHLDIESTPIDIKNKDFNEHLLDHINGLLSCFLVCFNLFPEQEDNHYNEGLPEGAKYQILANRYERSRINRNVCINHFGITCQACNLNFEKIYGAIGRGFIHVHHIVPIAQIGENYIINPTKDLVPVCPNCHAMIHKANPPLAIVELKKIIDLNKKV